MKANGRKVKVNAILKDASNETFLNEEVVGVLGLQEPFRLLRRDLDPSRKPDVFEFSRVVFGKNSAPMESQFVAQENARRNQDRNPLAAETVLKSTYMDDSIGNAESDEEGVELSRQLKAL